MTTRIQRLPRFLIPLLALILLAPTPAAERVRSRRAVTEARREALGRVVPRGQSHPARPGRTRTPAGLTPLAAARLSRFGGFMGPGLGREVGTAAARLRRQRVMASRSRQQGPRRLSPLVRELVAASRRGAALPAHLLGEASTDLLDADRIRMQLLLRPGVGNLDRDLSAVSAEVIRSTPTVVTVWVPYDNLPRLLEAETVQAVRLARRPARDETRPRLAAATSLAAGAVVSEGVALSGADVWQGFDSARFGVERETPVTIAIVDTGFFGYGELLGNELPATVTTADFAPAWDIEGCLIAAPLDPCFATGTALAEIVSDMNPTAELILVAVDPDSISSFQQAIDYLAGSGSGVPLASIVVGGAVWAPGLSGDGFGAGPYSRMISQLTAQGVSWINDLGDLDFLSFLLYGTDTPAPARDHWTGPFVDQVDHLFRGQFDADGYMDQWLPDQDPQSAETWLNEFCLGPGDYIFFDLVWDDWVDVDQDGIPETTEDYALDFWEMIDGKLVLFDTSSSLPDNFQGGEEGDYPWDTFDMFNSGSETLCYELAIFAEFALGDNRFHLYWAADNLTTPGQLSASFQAPASITAGNRMIPADTPGVIGVGTSSLTDQVEPFSPWGLEGEASPALCAPADVSTVTFADGGFVTSFAAAHVAGAVSLLMQKLGFVTTTEALELLEARARDITGSAPDVQCGAGRLCMLTGRCSEGL